MITFSISIRMLILVTMEWWWEKGVGVVVEWWWRSGRVVVAERSGGVVEWWRGGAVEW